MTAQSVPFNLYDHEIKWLPFAGIENLELRLCNIDEKKRVVDLLVRFPPNTTVSMHNHLAPTNMFIIQGELRIYEDDGSVREARPAGRYYEGRSNDVHKEGGGPEGAVVFYSVRATESDALFEVMEDDKTVINTVHMADVLEAWAAQQAAG